MSKHLFISLSMLLSFPLFSQSGDPQMADTFRQEGKIYVVICVIALIFVCLIGYLILIDRKLKKMEDRLRGNDPPQRDETGEPTVPRH